MHNVRPYVYSRPCVTSLIYFSRMHKYRNDSRFVEFVFDHVYSNLNLLSEMICRLTSQLLLNSNVVGKKIFVTVLYRSLEFNYTSPKFQTFLVNFKNLHLKIQAENPYAILYTGGCDAHSQLWWSDGKTFEGEEIENLISS